MIILLKSLIISCLNCQCYKVGIDPKYIFSGPKLVVISPVSKYCEKLHFTMQGHNIFKASTISLSSCVTIHLVHSRHATCNCCYVFYLKVTVLYLEYFLFHISIPLNFSFSRCSKCTASRKTKNMINYFGSNQMIPLYLTSFDSLWLKIRYLIGLKL